MLQLLIWPWSIHSQNISFLSRLFDSPQRCPTIWPVLILLLEFPLRQTRRDFSSQVRVQFLWKLIMPERFRIRAWYRRPQWKYENLKKTWCGVWSCFDCAGLLVVTSLGVHCTCIYLLGTPHYPWQFFYMIRFLHLFSSNRWVHTKGQVRVKYLPSSVSTEEHIQIVWLWALSLLYPVHEKAFNEIKCSHTKYINRWKHYMISLAIKL